MDKEILLDILRNGQMEGWDDRGMAIKKIIEKTKLSGLAFTKVSAA